MKEKIYAETVVIPFPSGIDIILPRIEADMRIIIIENIPVHAEKPKIFSDDFQNRRIQRFFFIIYWIVTKQTAIHIMEMPDRIFDKYFFGIRILRNFVRFYIRIRRQNKDLFILLRITITN